MKALWIKDLRLILRQQKTIAFLFIPMILLITIMGDNPMVSILYTVFVFPALPISTISYDSYENGMPWLLALPISRKEYVKEKYILALSVSILANILASGLYLLSRVIMGKEIDLIGNLGISLLAQSAVIIYCALVLPVNIRFGSEKGRIIMILMIMLLSGIIGGVGGTVTGSNAVIAAGAFNLLEAMIVLLVISCIVLIISYIVCVRWIEKKEY